MGDIVKKVNSIAVMGVRWEPEWLVEECITNLQPLVDRVEVLDNRHQSGEWQNEYDYRLQQREVARKHGARWFLLTSPDERWSAGCEDLVQGLYRQDRHQVYTVTIRELWTPTAYRVDGKFADRQRYRIFPVSMMDHLDTATIHNKIVPHKYRRVAKRTEIEVYHLKHIVEENRARRAEVMQKLDERIGKNRPGTWDKFVKSEDEVELVHVPTTSFYPPVTRQFVWDPSEAS